MHFHQIDCIFNFGYIYYIIDKRDIYYIILYYSLESRVLCDSLIENYEYIIYIKKQYTYITKL